MINTRSMLIAAYDALYLPGQTIELWGHGVPNGRYRPLDYVGWFDDRFAMADAALDCETMGATAVYCTVNPVQPEWLAFSSNKVTKGLDRRTTDIAILRRQWLFIDFDAVRWPKGVPRDLCATDEECEIAGDISGTVATFLTEQGWPEPLRAFSGNGWHLLYRIDLPNDDPSRDLVKGVLVTLATRFATERVEIDQAVFNAARLTKSYGTMSRKVEGVGRLQRRSELHCPKPFDQYGVTTADQLASIAAMTATKTAKKKRAKKGRGVDLKTFIAKHEIQVKTEKEDAAGGAVYVLHKCLFNADHNQGTGSCLGQTHEGAVYYKCHHAECTDKTWADVRKLFEPNEQVRSGQGADSDDPFELARAIIESLWFDYEVNELMIRRHRQSYYLYREQALGYQVIGHEAMNNAVTRELTGRVEKVTRTVVSDVINAIQALVAIDGADSIDMPFISRCDLARGGTPTALSKRRNMITLQNGILDMDAVMAGASCDEALGRHTSDWFTSTVLPYTFPTTPDEAACPHWTQFINDTTCDDEQLVLLIQEMMGYCLSPHARQEAFFLLYGEGRTGKSTLLDVIQAMLGEALVSTLTLSQLGHRTLPIQLYGKLANISRDLSEIDNLEEGTLKAIVSGEPITVDRKYRDAISFSPKAKLIFATNTLPRFHDTSEGIWRRLNILPFTNRVTMADRDIYLFDRKLKPELPGIFLWAIKGLARLEAEGRFTVSDRAVEATEQHRRWCFPILSFLDESTEEAEADAFVRVVTLYHRYRKWLEFQGFSKPKPMPAFVRDIKAFRGDLVIQRTSRRNGGYTKIHGIRMLPDDMIGFPP